MKFCNNRRNITKKIKKNLLENTKTKKPKKRIISLSQNFKILQ